MQRKLVRQGENALTVTLPAKWLKEQRMEAGDTVEVMEKDAGIFITRSSRGPKRLSLTIKESTKRLLRTVLSSAYKAGYDEITLRFSALPNIAEISEIVSSFTGWELISQSGNQVMIKSYLKQDEEAEALILKMLLITKHLGDELAEQWDKVELSNLRQLGGNNLLRLRDLCLRTIHTNGYGEERTYDYYDFVTILEKTAAEFLNLAQFISSHKTKKPALFKEISSLYDEIYSCYLKKDFNSSNLIWSKVQQRLRQKASPENLLRTSKKENPALMVYYYNLMQLLLHLSSRLVGLSRMDTKE